VTTADTYGELLGHPNVVAAVDIIFPNYYPYWEGQPIDSAMANVHRWHQWLVDAYPGKEIIVSESGWPSCGNPYGEAVPSPENASFYFLNFVSWARAEGIRYFYFSALDEPWKAGPEGPQGACWGVWTKDGVMKPGMARVFDGETIPDNWSNPPPHP
jgi:GPH family glycoside/pentoside/hexuronide:cation symporter